MKLCIRRGAYYLETWVPEWELSPSEQLWNRQAEALAEFVVAHDRFPHSREVVAGYPLGRWLVFQRELDQKRGDDAMRWSGGSGSTSTYRVEHRRDKSYMV